MKKKKMKMMSEHKDPAAVHYPQLDSEQRKNDEEEEESSSKPIQNPSPCLFEKKKKKKSKKEGKKLIEFRELGWIRINTCCTRFMSVFFST